jgi:hypothetical protein
LIEWSCLEAPRGHTWDHNAVPYILGRRKFSSTWNDTWTITIMCERMKWSKRYNKLMLLLISENESAVPDGGCASRRRSRKRCDHSAMRQGCRAASRLWLAGATRVAGSAAMSSSFSPFCLRLRFNKLLFESTAFFQYSSSLSFWTYAGFEQNTMCKQWSDLL